MEDSPHILELLNKRCKESDFFHCYFAHCVSKIDSCSWYQTVWHK